MSDAPPALTQAQANELISFLLSSAEITLKEPVHYGPLRLVDAVSRMIGCMEENGAVDEGTYLSDLKNEIDIKKQWCMWDKPGFYGFLRETPRGMAEYISAQPEETGE